MVASRQLSAISHQPIAVKKSAIRNPKSAIPDYPACRGVNVASDLALPGVARILKHTSQAPAAFSIRQRMNLL